jgi:hypothetical protein
MKVFVSLESPGFFSSWIIILRLFSAYSELMYTLSLVICNLLAIRKGSMAKILPQAHYRAQCS